MSGTSSPPLSRLPLFISAFFVIPDRLPGGPADPSSVHPFSSLSSPSTLLLDPSFSPSPSVFLSIPLPPLLSTPAFPLPSASPPSSLRFILPFLPPSPLPPLLRPCLCSSAPLPLPSTPSLRAPLLPPSSPSLIPSSSSPRPLSSFPLASSLSAPLSCPSSPPASAPPSTSSASSHSDSLCAPHSLSPRAIRVSTPTSWNPVQVALPIST